MSMSDSRSSRRPRVVLCASVLASWVLVGTAFSQSPPAPSPAKRAVDERKAIFTLIGSNFRPLGEQMQGRAALDVAEAKKRAERIAFLAQLATEAFSPASNVGDASTRAKPEIWNRRAEFDKAIADFVKHAQALSQVVATQGPKSEEFRTAAAAVAEDCKGCHDTYRSK